MDDEVEEIKNLLLGAFGGSELQIHEQGLLLDDVTTYISHQLVARGLSRGEIPLTCWMTKVKLNGSGETCEVSIAIFCQRALSLLRSPFTQALVGSPARNDAGSKPG